MLLALLALIVLSALSLVGYRWQKARPTRPHYLRRPFSTVATCSRRKPEWVRKELIRLKAHLPEQGCRKLADMFNRLFAAKGMTASKSYVSDLLRQHAYEVADLRRTWKTRISPSFARNQVWGLDLTGKMNVHNETHSILGIIDHGTRFAISLEAVRSASAIAILRVLFDVIERFGKPHILRTDNGSQFHSMLFRFALVLLGIRQQFSKPGMPWMNGRIERLFGTLKERLNHFSLADFSGLQLALAEFRVQYNLLRPHQHLDGRTPHEAWRKINPYQRPPKQIRYLVAWGGLLTGFYLQY